MFAKLLKQSPDDYFLTSRENGEFERNNDHIDASGLNSLFVEYTEGSDDVSEQPL
jgi:hypothetical protein